ncbi:MAG: ThuA domain-containing protein [Planctomycetales bacterium]|nr:ThuA domain-containing protein [Planctomycetales bacterium]
MTNCRIYQPFGSLFLSLTFWLVSGLSQAADLKILFLGDKGHHQPQQRADQLIPVLRERGIDITYTEDVHQLNTNTLKDYSGLIVFANIDVLGAQEEAALLEYVANGGGFIPLHCASFCFRNSSAYVDLVGAQFQRHGGEVFSTVIVAPDHPIMQGFGGFKSWDETYIHTRHNERNRIVLEVRRAGDQAEGRTEEPWTWVRSHGKGKVFYTAWGHDERTWGSEGFINLVERGIRWACDSDLSQVAAYSDPQLFPIPNMTKLRTDVAPFEFEEVGPKIPNYLAGQRWGTQGDVKTKMQKPLPPQESIKHYITPENFHLELFAAEPQIMGKPIAMNWDARGRLWLCETIDYPNELMPPEQGRDRIRICEDTNHDGVMDKSTVFAEHLSIPTSIEFYRDGIIVQAGIETLFLRDTNGDDRADQREILITGWEMGDTHGGVSNFQFGLDNRYWAMQGYNDSHPKFAGGSHRGFRQGPFNFAVTGTDRPAVSSVEFIRSTTNNSWGLGISEEGLIFASTANRAPSFFVPIPNRYYERVRGWTPRLMADEIADNHLFSPITENVRQVDHHGGYTAGAGHALYTARNYPEAWWNRVAFVCGPTGHLIGSFVLNRHGATFRDSNTFNLVASDDEWAAPIMAEVGPDGNIWIIDWYNYIVQHNPTPQGFKTGKGNAYESDLRDKTHGRIYRLVYDGAQPYAQQNQMPNLDVNRPETLVAALKHPNRLWRRHAQRLLVERGLADVTPLLLETLADPSVDAVHNNAGAVHALWTLKGLGALESANGECFDAVVAALRHPAAGVRRNAALVLPASQQSASALVDSGLAMDSDAQVQLGALMALADMPSSPQAGKLLSNLAGSAKFRADPFLVDGIICAAATHADSFLAGMLLTQVSAAANGTPLSDIVSVVAEHLARSELKPAELEALLVSLASGDPSVAGAVVAGLAAGWPRESSVTLSPSAEQSLQTLFGRLAAEDRAPLIRLASAWGSQGLRKFADEIAGGLLTTIQSNEASIDDRAKASREYVGLMGATEDAIAKLLGTVSPQMPSDVASAVITSLRTASADNVGAELVRYWPMLTPALREDALGVMLARPSSTRQLLAAVSDGTVSFTDLSLDQRQSLSSHPSREIRETANQLLKSSGVVTNADRQKVIENYATATHVSGNATIGKTHFVKNCANCHKHSGEGNDVGPDLTGMAVHPKEELIIHILDPNRSVEGNFRRYTVLTVEGQVLSGMLAAESLSAVELVDAEGKRHSIARDDIEQLTSTNLSLMPEGFEQQLNVEQMTDLLEFLSSKGKYVPLPLGSVATAISTKPMFGSDPEGPDRLVFSEWGLKEYEKIPFQVVDPMGTKRPNIVLLNGPLGTLPPRMPREVTLPCNMPVKALHFLSGVSGWGFPFNAEKSVTMIVRIHYHDGQTEDHPLLNGVHFADYIRREDVPGSEYAFRMKGQQIRYFAVTPKRQEKISSIDLVKGEDRTAPIVMAVTAESLEK